MKSVIGSLGTSEIGAGAVGNSSGPPAAEWRGICAGAGRRSQDKELDDFVGYAADAVRSIIAEGVEKAMTKFNRRAPGSNKEEA